ncbi:hypothetical protein TWF106_005791 [Orbilia oligospora]|uniref:Uncharacterized protein n=1 Tax=Orbilia oligospora TaxID=2813651 RepID=A0A7C8Q5H7_ORBOL|nr:hypothetical protein TWF106_005791 [Orbilia oligospora]
MDTGIAASSVGSTSKGRETTNSVSIIATDASTFVDRYSSSPTATSVAPHTSLQTSNKQPRDPVGPEFFYSSKLEVQCQGAVFTLHDKIRAIIADHDQDRRLAPPNMIPYNNRGGSFLPHVLYRKQWNRRIQEFKKEMRVGQDQEVQWNNYEYLVRRVYYDQMDCLSCLCDAKGNITFVRRPGNLVIPKGPKGLKVGCYGGSWAITCQWFYGCFCAVVLKNNSPSAQHIRQGLTWHAFQDAFNRIPDDIRRNNRDFEWVVPDWLAEYPGQTISYDPGFRVNVASPNEQPYFLEGQGEVLPSDLGAALGIHQEAVPNLTPEDLGLDPPTLPEDPSSDPNYLGGGQPLEDPFPADIEAWARQQASLWPLPNANQPLPPGQDVPSFFPMDIPEDYENYLLNDGTGDSGSGSGSGSGGFYYEYPPGNYDFPAEHEYNSGPRGGGGGSGSGSGFFKKREAKLENSKAGDDEIAHGIGEVDQGRREVVAPV